MRLFVNTMVAAVLGAAPTPARANGAFPAPFRIFAPSNASDEMLVATNFGLIETGDGGQTWSWTCEHGLGDSGYLYQQVLPPSRRLLALSLGLNGIALVSTDSGGCAWTEAAGLPMDAVIVDYFVDPANGTDVFAVVRRNVSDMLTFSVIRSMDGGTSFPSTPLYTAQPGTSLDSFEVAPSDHNRMFATLAPLRPDGTGPWLARSDDGGHSFAVTDASALTGSGMLRIISVAPADKDRILLRFVADSGDERLLLSTDGGRTITNLFTPAAGTTLTAFLQRQDGTMFVAGMQEMAGRLYRSTDGGKSFAMVASNLHVGSLVERAGLLYALGDGVTDPFVVGVSDDNGNTFRPFLKFSDVKGIKTCATNLVPICADICANLSSTGIFPPTVCSTSVTTGTHGDGGVADARGSVGDSGGAGGADGGAVAGAPPNKAGCSCSADASTPSSDFRIAAGMLSLLVASATARRRQARSRPQRLSGR